MIVCAVCAGLCVYILQQLILLLREREGGSATWPDRLEMSEQAAPVKETELDFELIYRKKSPFLLYPLTITVS